MKNLIITILMIITVLNAQALFEVKDASNHSVFEIFDNGIRILSYPDTLMIISSDEIRANLDNSQDKALSRSFSVSTTTTAKAGLANVLEVTTNQTTMREGVAGDQYTNFSPLNLFLGLQAGENTTPTSLPFVGGDENTYKGKFNIFVGNESGRDNSEGYYNLFIGEKSGQNNSTGVKNTFHGTLSGQANEIGGYNSFFGYQTGITSLGAANTFIGANCGFNNGSNGYNTYMGYAAGEYFQGSNNTFIGNEAGRNAYSVKTGSGNVFIGYKTGSASGSISNKLYIANSNTNTPLIYGDFSTNNVGIGTNAPSSNRLKVIGVNSGITGAAGYFENTNTAGIGLAVFATSTDAAFYAEQKNSTSTTANIAKFASAYGGWSEKMIIRSTGRVYTPYLASGTGTALYLTSGNEIVKYSSSKKYKKDIIPLSVDHSKFMNLQPVSFKWNEKSASENKPDYGLIAEEVEKIDPELAVYDEEGTIEGVNYQKVNIMLLKVVQEQQKKINKLEKDIEGIKKLLK